MSDVRYQITRDNGLTGVDNIVAFFPNKKEPIKQANSNHPHWKSILSGLQNGTDVYDLFDVKSGLLSSLRQVSDRISFDGENILFDGDVQSGPLADHLFRCLESGIQDYKPVAKFWEKVAQNPDNRSREQLFTWLRSHNFTITTEGDILGYKGVLSDNNTAYRSVSSGTAYVDGVQHVGQIPNPIGAVVTMPRSEVKNDPNVACHKGLHVGDWSYASNFADVVLEVHVNPRDVVSIPNDHSFRKMRCCRYQVVGRRSTESRAPIHYPEDERGSWEDVGYVSM